LHAQVNQYYTRMEMSGSYGLPVFSKMCFFDFIAPIGVDVYCKYKSVFEN